MQTLPDQGFPITSEVSITLRVLYDRPLLYVLGAIIDFTFVRIPSSVTPVSRTHPSPDFVSTF